MGISFRVYENVQLVNECDVQYDEDDEIVFPENAVRVNKTNYGEFRQFGNLIDDGVYTYDNTFALVKIAYSSWSKYRNIMCMKMGLQPTESEDSYLNIQIPYIKTMVDMCGDDNYAVFNHTREHVLLSDLILHSDCDGFISTKYCRIIYNDLLKYERLYYDTSVNDGYNTIHDNLKRTFKVAAKNNGIVRVT